MALIFCTNCGKQISDRAPVCPYCGFAYQRNASPNMQSPVQQQVPVMVPQKEKPKGKGKIAVIVVIIVIVVVGVIAGICVPTILGNKPDGSDQQSSQTSSQSAAAAPSTTAAETTATTTTATTVSHVEQETYTVNFSIITKEGMVSDYDVRFYIDGECIDTISCNQVRQYAISLKRGTHVIKFARSSDGEKDSETTLSVTEDMDVTYTLQLKSGPWRDIEITRS